MLDNVAELLTREGQFPDESRDVRHAMAMLVPAAWEGALDLDDDVRAFYRWHASVMEPWDGPAALIFADGVRVGAVLDRNGLRPRPRSAVLEPGFAQVTSPAIDHVRERHVMSLTTLLGPRDPLLWERPEAAAMLEYPTFLLFRLPGGAYLDATWPIADGPDGL